MNLAALEQIIQIVLKLDPVVLGVLKRLLASGVLVGPLAKLKPFVQELEHALEFVDQLHNLHLPAPAADAPAA